MSRSLRATVVAAALLAGALGVNAIASPANASDPSPLSLSAGRYLGGPADELTADIARAADGSVYVLAHLSGAAFPLDAAGYKGGRDALVLRLSPDLQTITWAKTLGGTGDDYPAAIEVDGGSVLVAGTTASPNFPTTPGVLNPGPAASADGFVTRLDAGTGSIVWSTRIGGATGEDLTGMAVGPDGRIWLAGSTYGAGFPTTPDGNSTNAGLKDAFLSALSSDGAALSYSTKFGSPDADGLEDVAVGADGRIYALGALNGWVPGAPTHALAGETMEDVAVLRYSLSGTKPVLDRVSYVGGDGPILDPSFAVDASGATVVAGTIGNQTLTLVRPIQASVPMPSLAGFAARISPTGTTLEWSTYLGTTAENGRGAVAVDGRGDAYLTGTTSGDLPVGSALQPAFVGGFIDGYLVKITAEGRLAYGTHLGSTGQDVGTAVTLDPSGAPLVGLGTLGTLPMPTGSADASKDGGADAAVLRVETTATVTGLTGPTGATTNRTPTWTFGTDLLGAQTECRIDTAAWAPCAGTYTAAALTDGTHTFQVHALDRPGHPGPAATATLTVDTTADTTIAKHPRKKTRTAKARFTFTSERGATFTCKVDKLPWKACGSTLTVRVKKGRHTLRVRATDALGNTDATPAVFRWKRR